MNVGQFRQNSRPHATHAVATGVGKRGAKQRIEVYHFTNGDLVIMNVRASAAQVPLMRISVSEGDECYSSVSNVVHPSVRLECTNFLLSFSPVFQCATVALHATYPSGYLDRSSSSLKRISSQAI